MLSNFRAMRNTLLVLVVVLTPFAIALSLWRTFNRSDFPERRLELNSIVQKVKASGIKVGQTRLWKVTSAKGVVTLVPPPLSYPLSGSQDMVNANRTSQGYVISVVTSDLGHFGMSGYIFSDAPLNQTFDPDGFWTVDRQQDEHWWSVSNADG